MYRKPVFSPSPISCPCLAENNREQCVETNPSYIPENSGVISYILLTFHSKKEDLQGHAALEVRQPLSEILHTVLRNLNQESDYYSMPLSVKQALAY